MSENMDYSGTSKFESNLIDISLKDGLHAYALPELHSPKEGEASFVTASEVEARLDAIFRQIEKSGGQLRGIIQKPVVVEVLDEGTDIQIAHFLVIQKDHVPLPPLVIVDEDDMRRYGLL